MATDYLFVYGTLRSQAMQPMGSFLRGNAELLGMGFMLGLLFEIDGYPGAVESRSPEHRVFGEIYKLKEPEWLLSRLDEYEECAPAFPLPHEYIRKILPVTLLVGGQVDAWIYVFNRNTDRLPLLSSGECLGTCLDATAVKN